jgi:hypothetical protein
MASGVNCDKIKVAIRVRPLLKRKKETKLWNINDNSVNSLNKQYNYSFGKEKNKLSLLIS